MCVCVKYGELLCIYNYQCITTLCIDCMLVNMAAGAESIKPEQLAHTNPASHTQTPHTHTHSCTYTNTGRYTRIHRHVHLQTKTHTQTHTGIHSRTDIRRRIYWQIYIHAQEHTLTCTHKGRHSYTGTHNQTEAHTWTRRRYHTQRHITYINQSYWSTVSERVTRDSTANIYSIFTKSFLQSDIKSNLCNW